MFDFNKYKYYQSRFKMVIDGIRVSYVTTFSIAAIVNKQDISLCFKPLVLLTHSYDFRKLKFDAKVNEILTTSGFVRRKDYKEVYDFVCSELGTKASVNYLYDLDLCLSFHPFMLIRLLYYTLIAFGNQGIGIRNFLKFYLDAAFMCNNILELRSLNIKGIKKYLSFENAIGLENAITQFFNLRDIPTYSLCEGIYNAYPQMDCIDALQHENCVTSKLMCWGDYSKKAFESVGVSSERLVVSGYPHPVKSSKMKIENSFKKCVVLLARNDFFDADIRLLTILNNFSDTQTFYLKLHPFNDYNTFKHLADDYNMQIIEKSMSINDCIDNQQFDFAIAVNTTSYYEALMRGLPCLRFKDSSYGLMEGYSDTFETEHEYRILISKMKSIDINVYQAQIDSMLTETIGYKINRYKDLLIER